MNRNSRRSWSRRDFMKSLSQGGLAISALAPSSVIARTFLEDRESYDYIVIGSGPGGAPVACRLAAAGFRVLIVEAGKDVLKEEVSTPAFHLKSTEDPDISWDYFVKHFDRSAQHGFKFQDEESGILYPRVGAVGGCTLHNAMIGLYPNIGDLETWSKVSRDPRFNPQSMRWIYENRVREYLPLETTSPTLALKDSQLLRMYRSALEVALEHEGKNFFGASAALFENLSDFDPNSQENLESGDQGFFFLPKITQNGRRWTTRDLILETQKKYPGKLLVATQTLVKKIVFSEDRSAATHGKLKALGVECVRSERAYEASPQSNPFARFQPARTIFATKEVILSAGAFNSPQILMVSGIGDEAQLRRNGIRPLLHRAGVGKNLQDRYEIAHVSRAPKNYALIENCEFGGESDPCMKDYRKDPKKALYGSNGLVAGLKLKSSPELREPDLMIFGGPVSFKGYYPGYSKDALERKDQFTWAVLKGQTKNHSGEVRLRSDDPFVRPDIHFHYFEDGAKEDLRALRTGLGLTRRIFDRANEYQVSSFREPHTEIWPGVSVQGEMREEDFIRKESWGHHASCSNAMGLESDEQSVVDGNFRVHGTANLRVVDASVFPKIPGLFIVLPIFMIAEKAALDILEGR